MGVKIAQLVQNKKRSGLCVELYCTVHSEVCWEQGWMYSLTVWQSVNLMSQYQKYIVTLNLKLEICFRLIWETDSFHHIYKHIL